MQVVPALTEKKAFSELSGYSLLDNTFVSIVSTEFLVGGIVAVILDNFFKGKTDIEIPTCYNFLQFPRTNMYILYITFHLPVMDCHQGRLDGSPCK